MELCSDGHDEVCFEVAMCPACAVQQDKDAEIDKLTARVSDLESEVEDLKAMQTE